MTWTVLNWIFGIICIVGPLSLIFWFAKAFRIRMKEFKERTEPKE